MITFHVLVNVGMTTGVMPVTGIPLPMFSYGGSNMITNLAAIGLVLNINMRRQKYYSNEKTGVERTGFSFYTFWSGFAAKESWRNLC